MTQTNVAPAPETAAEDSTEERKIETLAKRIARIRERAGGVRPVQPIDLMGITPASVDGTQPEPLMVRPQELWIDGSYQRDLSKKSKSLIMDIIQNFSWAKFKPPVITRDDQGRYVIIDGQHTAIAAASHPSIKKIPAMFVSTKTVSEQAGAFVGHNTSRINPLPLDIFFAKLTAGDEVITGVYELCQKYNIEIVKANPNTKTTYEANQTMAVSTLRNLFKKYGKAKTSEILDVVSQSKFRPIRQAHLAAVAELLYGVWDDNERRLDKKLLIETIESQSDSDAMMNARRIKESIGTSLGKALAIFYRNKYFSYFK